MLNVNNIIITRSQTLTQKKCLQHYNHTSLKLTQTLKGHVIDTAIKKMALGKNSPGQDGLTTNLF